MLVSWNWLQEYVSLEGVTVADLTDRLTMSGLNLEEYSPVADDWVIDLEVTSNRPDCLGHLGVAREVAALLGRELRVPQPKLSPVAHSSAAEVQVQISASDMCSYYCARIIRGVKVGPSPEWLQSRLKTVGISSVNNVVDITNYLMLECAQPLHAFDLQQLQGTPRKIDVRRARSGEKLRAINQKEYQLTVDQCVIADESRPVAIAGVMGGLDSEIRLQTVDVLIEAASFAPLMVRNTARKLDLHSPSSYRFERALDPQGPEYASRRCCELILQLAGGQLLDGVVTAGTPPATEGPEICLRLAQIKRLLGIEIPRDAVQTILTSLGLQLVAESGETLTFRPPTFRRDLTREVDLIEEVARIHGYHQLPDDVVVPLCTSKKSLRQRIVERVGETLTAVGYFEAVTPAFQSAAEQNWFQPYGGQPSLQVDHSSRRQENLLRQSLIPSLLNTRRNNERQGNFQAQLFEIAKVYLAANPNQDENTVEPWMIGLVTHGTYRDLKGVVELLARRIQPGCQLTIKESAISQFTPGRGAELYWNETHWGWIGELDRSVCDQADVRDTLCVAELRLDVLDQNANLVPSAQKLGEFPGMTRDLNFVLDESVPWSAVEQEVRSSGGPLLTDVRFADQYRGKQLGEGKKSYVVTLTFRSDERTLTGDEVDLAQRQIIDCCTSVLQAALRA